MSYTGVCLVERRGIKCWWARAIIHGVKLDLGLFENEHDAAYELCLARIRQEERVAMEAKERFRQEQAETGILSRAEKRQAAIERKQLRLQDRESAETRKLERIAERQRIRAEKKANLLKERLLAKRLRKKNKKRKEKPKAKKKSYVAKLDRITQADRLRWARNQRTFT